jgi:hypothetical protein
MAHGLDDDKYAHRKMRGHLDDVEHGRDQRQLVSPATADQGQRAIPKNQYRNRG